MVCDAVPAIVAEDAAIVTFNADITLSPAYATLTPEQQFYLYTFRCAVYYASNEQHDPELLKWWNWKDK